MPERPPSLDEALRALEEHDRALGASGHVADRLRSEVRAIGRTRRLRQYLLVSAAAVVVLAALWSTRLRTPVPASAPVLHGEVATAFFPLTFGGVPVTDGQIVRVEVPRASLAAFGLEPLDAAPERTTVVADVLVGEDGLARAVRFVGTTNR